MPWRAPTPTLKVALGHGRFTEEPSSGDYTDLSDRIVDTGWRVNLCERQSPRDQFGPGSLEVVLDNDDRMLDPSNPDGLVYVADGQGLPGAPVTFDLTYNGVTERRFKGYLVGPAWAAAGSSRVGGSPVERTVRLVARDWMDHPPDLPNSAWAIATLGAEPDWYLPMDPPNAVLSTGSEIPDRSGRTSGHATTTVPSGLARPHQGPGGWVPWMALPGGATITSAAADIMPSGDEDSLTAWCWWSAETALTSGQTAMVMKMVAPGGSTRRWAIWVDDAGVAQIETYDSGGSVEDSATITGLSRWDNGQGHFVVARFTAVDNELKVWFGGFTATLTVVSTLYESDLVCGPADVGTYSDEVTVFRRSLPDAEVQGVLLDAGNYIGQWFGHSYADRLGALLQAAGVTVTSDYSEGWRVPADDTATEGFVSLNVGNLPSDALDGYRKTVGPLGTVVVNRFGFPVARTIKALEVGGDYEAEYVTPTAHFTDEAGTLSGVQLRHAGASRSAVREDLIVNRVEGAFYYLMSLGPPVNLMQLPHRPESTTVVDGRRSHQQFGWRQIDHGMDRYGWVVNASECAAILARYAWPTEAGFDVVHLDAMNDDDLVAWLMTAEPEMAADVTYTPPGADPVTVEGLNLQGLSITGTTTTLRAEARLFRS